MFFENDIISVFCVAPVTRGGSGFPERALHISQRKSCIAQEYGKNILSMFFSSGTKKNKSTFCNFLIVLHLLHFVLTDVVTFNESIIS